MHEAGGRSPKSLAHTVTRDLRHVTQTGPRASSAPQPGKEPQERGSGATERQRAPQTSPRSVAGTGVPKTLAKSQINAPGNPPISEGGMRDAETYWFRHPISLDWACLTERRITMRVAIYARVSTDGQSVNTQLAELREVAERRGWEIALEYIDKGISGAKGRDQRPALDAMLKAAIRREFDMVAVWAVDRFGRSLSQVALNMDELNAVGVNFYAHKQGMDTTTTWGKGMLQMAGVFASIEREIIRERVRAGMKVAKAEQVSGKERLHKNGRVKKPIGRPRAGADVEHKVRELRKQDWGVNRIARELGIGSGTVRRIAYE